MNKFFNIKITLALSAMVTLSLSACEDDTSDISPIVPTNPTFVSATPQIDSYVQASEADTILVKYDKMIFFESSKANSIAISAGSITSARVLGADSVLTIVANMKQKGTTYTITIPDGLVLGANGTAAAGVTLTYKTQAAKTMSTTPVQATSSAAKSLYTYLMQQYGNKTLSGMMANVAWNNTESEKVNTLTGKYPAINGYDYIHIPASVSGADWINYSDITPVKEWADAGGIVAAGWHWLVPKEEVRVPTTDVDNNETTIWSGSENMGTEWAAALNIEADKCADIADGTLLKIYTTHNSDAEYWQVKVYDKTGNAYTGYADIDNGWGCIELGSATEASFTLSSTDAEDAKTNGINITGYGITITKVTISTGNKALKSDVSLVTSLNVNTDFTYEPKSTTFDLKNAVTEGTWEYNYVQYDLANISKYLLLLKEANIPVLWRPLHEASGGWFWWGTDAESFKKLWIMMFNYFKEQGIDNLIWVWTSQIGDDTWYPGDNYVDIVGCDLYGTTTDPAQSYTSLTNTYSHKIVTLSECGWSDNSNDRIANISTQINAGAKWSWFMPWYDNADATNKHADDTWWQDAMQCEQVITRDQLPEFK